MTDYSAFVGLAGAFLGALITSLAQRTNRKHQERKDRLDRVASLLEQTDVVLTEYDAILRHLTARETFGSDSTIRPSIEKLANALARTRHHAQYLRLTSPWVIVELVDKLESDAERLAVVAGSCTEDADVDKLREPARAARVDFVLDRRRLTRFVRADKTLRPWWAPLASSLLEWSRRRQLESLTLLAEVQNDDHSTSKEVGRSKGERPLLVANMEDKLHTGR